jgi:nicotinate-nucleotide pyrophosphorylase (carboxylating)
MTFPFSDATRQLIRLALLEDLHAGDVTTDAVFDDVQTLTARFGARESLVVAGIPMVEEVFALVDPDVRCTWRVADGGRCAPGEVLGEVHGRVRSVLRAERVALNFLRHLSGVATLTRRCADILGDDGPKIVDTRKTTPGFREIEKYAVRMGGGRNHRYNLSSGVMLKDNHIAAAGSIAEAVRRVRAHAPFLLRVEVEVQDHDELRQALDAGADAVLLDNMNTESMAEAVRIVGGRALVEASGGITEARLAELRGIGLDFISSGALTHSAPNVDIGLDVDEGP